MPPVPVHVTGLLATVDPRRLAILVHGLGGCRDSRYLRRAARQIADEGWSSLRLDLRGADGSGSDLYHAGLSADLAAAVADPALADFEQIVLLGFSLGGHLVLRYATETTDPRVIAAAAICSPVDLASTVDIFDAPAGAVYRRYVLSGLKRTYRQIAARQPVPTPIERIEMVTRIREWDELTVVPRFGFGSADHYYASQSVAPRLEGLRIPALLVASERDPMVDIESIRHALPTAGDRLTVRLLHAGGHVAFPERVDLHLQPRAGRPLHAGVVGQAMRWLASR